MGCDLLVLNKSARSKSRLSYLYVFLHYSANAYQDIPCFCQGTLNIFYTRFAYEAIRLHPDLREAFRLEFVERILQGRL